MRGVFPNSSARLNGMRIIGYCQKCSPFSYSRFQSSSTRRAIEFVRPRSKRTRSRS
jgi:hypothetical protein